MGLGKRIVLFFLACALGVLVANVSGSAGPVPHPDYTDALWIADSSRGLKVALSDGRVLLEILDTGRIEALTINEEAGVLWAYAKGRLFAYDFSGQKLFTRAIPERRAGHAPGPRRARLALNPLDGSVWLGTGRKLYHVDAGGEVLQEIRLEDPFRSLSFDRTRNQLWIGTKRSITAYDASGQDRQRIAIGRTEKLRALAYDETLDTLWVALADRGLRRYLPDTGAITLDTRLNEPPRALHPDMEGGVWIAARRQLLHADSSGQERLDLKPFAGRDNTITALAVDPREGSVWVASRGALREVERNGALKPPMELGGDHPRDIRVLALYTDRVPPRVEISAPREGGLLSTRQPPLEVGYEDQGIGIDDNTRQWTADGNPLPVRCEVRVGGAICTPTEGLPEGLNTLQASIADLNGNRGESAVISFTIDTIAPAAPAPDRVRLEPPEAGSVTVSGGPGSVEPFAEVTITNTRTGEAVTVTALLNGSFRAQIAAQVGDVLHIDVADAAGNRGASLPFTVAAAGGELPPDPVTVASSLAETEITPLHEATAFLYSGANPIQTGVAAGTIVPRRAAVVRGQVLSRDNQPISGVTVTIKDHPEFGQTRSRADGRFDLAVNGGGLLTVNYEKPGYLPVQRQVHTPWQDFAFADDVVMIQLDPRVTTVDLAGSTSMQVAQGSVSTDADGSRRATVLFPRGTVATMTLSDGAQQALTSIHVRATEYTVGANGPKAMPGPLPPTSGYTYAVELSVDEALAAGAKRVDFSQAVPVYIDNFLDFPVGGIVPVGWYDRDESAWIPSDNGRIVKVLGVDAGGIAQLDTEGNGQIADAAKLAALGISDAELARIAALYPVGKTLWRVPISHFTPWDCNWPFGPPEDAEPPPSEEPETPDEDQPDPEDSDDCPGCSIEAQSQTLGEEIPIAGTPFKLHYRSDRVPGRLPASVLDVPLTGSTLASSLKRIDLAIAIAGRQITRSFAPSANLEYHFVWDGKDAYGRSLSAKHTATVDITFVYPAVYYEPSGFARAFAAVSSRAGGTGGGAAIGRNRASGDITLAKRWKTKLAGPAPLADGLGGWSLSAHHVYAVPDGELFTGDGGKRSATKLFNTITTVAGNGDSGFSGDGGPASHASLSGPATIALGPDGSLYIADTSNHRIRRVGPDGIIRTVAGNEYGFSGDGGPATQGRLVYPASVTVGVDGSLYIADTGNHRVRRIAPDGIITTVAGKGTRDFRGDGGPATRASLAFPTAVARGADGSLYIADTGNRLIRRVGPDGIITTVAGSIGVDSSSVVLGADGSLYLADASYHRIRRVGPDGIITTVAGNGSFGFSGDGGPATQAALSSQLGVALGADGSLYISDAFYHLIRRVGPDGIITTVAGNGSFGLSGDGGPALQASLSSPSGVAVSADGSLYIADTYSHRIRRVALPFPGFTGENIAIAAEDGTALYRFDASGRHRSTEDTLTGHMLYRFAYDPAGFLVQITDRDGDLTRIQRDGSGHPTAIVAPDGQRATLTLDTNGFLASVTNPAGERHTVEYTAHGLMTAFTDPKGNTNRFEYDALGRLVKDTNAGGGGWTLTRAKNAQGYTNAMTTAEGRTTTFEVEPLP
ncbi:MAG: NHL domain-containing protein, partial [Gammaproteobacteria bacterium]